MPGTAAGVGLAYRPRSPSNTLTDVVEDHLGELLRVWDERYRKDHGPFHPRLERAIAWAEERMVGGASSGPL